jgi:hypothetical protein
MLNKVIPFVIIVALTGAISVSCSEDIPECPSKMCILAGKWKLTEVYVDGAKESGDLSKYELSLTMPAPVTATASDFVRVQPSGANDNGVWSVENNGSVLRLMPFNDPLLTEDWIIDRFTPRELVLVINRDTGIKDGPSKIEFVLEPF